MFGANIKYEHSEKPTMSLETYPFDCEFDFPNTKYLCPKRLINNTLAKIRDDHDGVFREKTVNNIPTLMDELPNIEITALKIDENSPVINKSLFEVQLRKNTVVTFSCILPV